MSRKGLIIIAVLFVLSFLLLLLLSKGYRKIDELKSNQSSFLERTGVQEEGSGRSSGKVVGEKLLETQELRFSENGSLYMRVDLSKVAACYPSPDGC